MSYTGTIIEESLEDTSLLNDLKILSTVVEEVTPKHQTPWLKKWALHRVEIDESAASKIAKRLSKALEKAHPWYADYKNDFNHYIIFPNKVFYIDRRHKDQYEAATKHGLKLGIPEYQLDFTRHLIK